jgi:hypothetical protein
MMELQQRPACGYGARLVTRNESKSGYGSRVVREVKRTREKGLNCEPGWRGGQGVRPGRVGGDGETKLLDCC